jgi:hypothetical protein
VIILTFWQRQLGERRFSVLETYIGILFSCASDFLNIFHHLSTHYKMHSVYSDLAPAGVQIRLALLSPAASFDDPVHATLSVVSLFDQPKYKALSYVWGNKEDNVPI